MWNGCEHKDNTMVDYGAQRRPFVILLAPKEYFCYNYLLLLVKLGIRGTFITSLLREKHHYDSVLTMTSNGKSTGTWLYYVKGEREK